MARGLACLFAVVGWFGRKIVSWWRSITMETVFCGVAVEMALARYAKLGILNTDQGSQRTPITVIAMLKGTGIAVSMDCKGGWITSPPQDSGAQSNTKRFTSMRSKPFPRPA